MNSRSSAEKSSDTRQAKTPRPQHAPEVFSSASPREAVMSLQKTCGNGAVQRMFEGRYSALLQRQAPLEEEEPVCGKSLQPKLTLSSPDDACEREAEQVAEEVSTFSHALHSSGLQPSLLSRLSVPRVMGLTGVSPKSFQTTAHSGRKLRIYANTAEGTTEPDTVSPGIESRIMQSRGTGSPLPAHVHNTMSLRTGYDFSSVRVKTDGEAADLSQSINARAFTVGSDVWLGKNESPDDIRLMSHELTHVVQQGAARPVSTAGTSGLDTLRHTSAVMGYLQGLTRGSSPDSSVYTREIERFEMSNPPDRIAELHRQILEKPQGGETGRSGDSQAMRACSGCGGGSSGSGTTALPKKTVTVNVTKMHGSGGSPSTDITYANTKVYSQANVEVKSGGETVIDEANSKKVLGDDLILDEFTSAVSPTDEEKALLKLNQTSGAVTAYYVKGLSHGSIGENFRPGHGTGLIGVVSTGAHSRTLAHELGHLLLDEGSHPGDPDNFMAQTSTASGKELMTATQITKVRSSAYVK
jgi:hypothetical protein